MCARACRLDLGSTGQRSAEGYQTVKDLLKHWCSAFVEPRRTLGIGRLGSYFIEFQRYRRLESRNPAHWRDTYPCLSDRTRQTPVDPHYLYQGYWVTEKLVKFRPAAHIDVGSSLALMSTVNALVPVTFVDLRPARLNVPSMLVVAGNLVNLPMRDRSVQSLSCLHVIEHVGLGRYGDALDPDGTAKAARELCRILAPGGRLLLSVPVGRERVAFNAHRVLAPKSILEMCGDLTLADFSLVDDDRVFRAHTTPDAAANLEYGCGLFEFVR